MLRSPDSLAAPTTPQRWLFVLLLLVSIAVGRAQDPILAQPAVGRIERDFLIDQWSISEGLPNSSVSAIGESTDGFLWVGTGDGLVRFDGTTFRSHGSGRDTDSGLMSIAGFHAGPDGTLWMADAWGRLHHWDRGHLRRHPLPAGISGEIDGWVNLPGVGVVASCGTGLFVVPTDARVATPTTNSVHPLITVTRAGWLWHAFNGQLHRCRVEAVRDSPPPWQAVGTIPPASRIAPASSGGLWRISPASYQRVADDGSQGPERPSPWRRDNWALRVLEDTRGGLWVGTSMDGIWYCPDPSAPDPQFRHWFPNSRALCLHQDRSGAVWVGLDGGGLLRFRPRWFTSHRVPADGAPKTVHGVSARPDGTAWFTIPGHGVYLATPDGVLSQTNFGWPAQIRFPWPVLESSPGHIWVGSYGGPVMEWNLAQRTGGPAHSVHPAGMTLFMAQDPAGRAWFGSYLGIGFAAGEGHIQWLSLPDWAITRISGVLPVRTNELWVGLRPGLAHLRVEGTNGHAQYLPGFSQVHVTSLCADGPDAFWVGTIDHGLFHIRPGRAPVTLHTGHGLNLHRIHSIIADLQGNLWLATERGIARIEAQPLRQALQGSNAPLQWRLFTEQDGLPSRETSYNSQPIASISPDGRLWFATVAGLASVDPTHPPSPPPLPGPIIDEVSSQGSVLWALYADEHNRPAPDRSGPSPGTFPLARGRREIEFRFTAPAPAHATSPSLRHRLIGVDRDWIPSGTRRSALYPSLPPGSHRFEVQTLDASGNPVGSIAPLTVTVPHFFWERTAFQVANAAVVVGIIAASSRWLATRRLRRRLADIERERSIERERARIARDMHDQLGADLTRVKLLGEMTHRDLYNPSRAGEHLDRLANTTLDLVRALDEIVWAVNPAKDRLDNFLSYLGAYATEFSESTGIACRTDFPAELQSQSLPASIRHNLFLVVKESLNNAAKHAGVHEVHVRVQVLDHQVRVEVSDAGAGFDPETIRNGRHGLAGLRQRMAEIGGEIRWETAPGKGTCVVARVPLPH